VLVVERNDSLRCRRVLRLQLPPFVPRWKWALPACMDQHEILLRAVDHEEGPPHQHLGDGRGRWQNSQIRVDSTFRPSPRRLQRGEDIDVGSRVPTCFNAVGRRSRASAVCLNAG